MEPRRLSMFNIVAGIGFIGLGIYFIVLKDRLFVGIFELAIGASWLGQAAYKFFKKIN